MTLHYVSKAFPLSLHILVDIKFAQETLRNSSFKNISYSKTDFGLAIMYRNL